MIIKTHSQITIFLFDKKDKGISWRLWISNESLLHVFIFIEVFMKRCKFVLRQIIDGSKWRLLSFHKINGVVIESMLGQGVCILKKKHIWILGIRKEFHVEMVQHLVKEEYKWRMHLLLWQPSRRLLF